MLVSLLIHQSYLLSIGGFAVNLRIKANNANIMGTNHLLIMQI